MLEWFSIKQPQTEGTIIDLISGHFWDLPQAR
jgi:hypothetical protein